VTASGTYYIKGTNANGCSAIQSVVVTVNAAPVVVTVAPAAVCAGSTVDLTATAVTTGSDTGLTFTYFTDMLATTALATPAAVTASGTYYIKGTNANGCSAIQSVVVTVNAAPVVVTVAPAAVCAGSTIDLTATAVTTGSDTGLMFTYFTDMLATTTLATPAAVTASGTYYIKGTNANGCSAIQSVVVTVNAAPVVVTVAPAAVCAGSTIDLTATAVTSGSDTGLTFTYFTNSNATVAYATPSAAMAGTYYIKGTSASGCSAIASVVVSSLPSLDNSVTSGVGVLNATLSGATYQWYTCPANTPIAGATNQSYMPTLAGDYGVTITMGGCSVNSACVMYTPLEVKGFDTDSFKYFPNPVTDLLNVSYSKELRSVKVFNMIGQQVYFRILSSNEAQVDMSNLPSGSYFVEVNSLDASKTIRIIKK
jgi:Secretion system C-terminal sorting domain/Ig-like domain CHU_C associated